MTAREYRLRRRIDTLSDELATTRSDLTRAKKRLGLHAVPKGVPLRRCVYCGRGTRKPVACHAHQDLLALDPFYADPYDVVAAEQEVLTLRLVGSSNSTGQRASSRVTARAARLEES